MNRGRALLIAQRPGPALGPPPPHLNDDEVAAWNDLVRAAPDVLRFSDSLFLGIVATSLAMWRAGDRELWSVREIYRDLGRCFIPMRERRRLLFPEKSRP